MVNLSDKQETLLGNVDRQKAIFDTEWAQEEARHKLAEETLKRPVRDAIAAADEAGVPQLRIAKKTGFNQVNQLTNWLRDRTEGSMLSTVLSSRKTLVEAETAVQGSGVTFVEDDANVWTAVNGKEKIQFELYNYGGQRVAVIVGDEDTDGWPEWFEDALGDWDKDVLHGWPED